jgi:hypothetical protein
MGKAGRARAEACFTRARYAAAVRDVLLGAAARPATTATSEDVR